MYANGFSSSIIVRWGSRLRVFFFLGMMLAWLVTTVRASGNAGTAFDQANKLYEQGKYPEAAASYEQLLKDGNASAALYFNLGNARFKAGQTGLAIASYLQAERLDPRDPDIQANLKFARASVSGNGTQPGHRWVHWIYRLTLNEWTVLTASATALWLLLLALGQLRANWRTSLRGYTTATGLAMALLMVVLGLALRERIGITKAIVASKEAVVRYGPLEESQSFFTARDGTELEVQDHKDLWIQVADANGRSGWLQQANVVELK